MCMEVNLAAPILGDVRKEEGRLNGWLRRFGVTLAVLARRRSSASAPNEESSSKADCSELV